MKNIHKSYFIIALSVSVLISCNSTKQEFDATGVFEAEEIIISAESSGKLLSFIVSEGDNLKVGQEIGQID